jgi:hypothetical protein
MELSAWQRWGARWSDERMQRETKDDERSNANSQGYACRGLDCAEEVRVTELSRKHVTQLDRIAP